MLLSDVVAVFLVIVGLLLTFPGLWLLCRSLWPNIHEDCVQRSTRGMIAPFFIGLPITVVLMIIVASLQKNGGPRSTVAWILLLCLYLLFANTGIAGIATLIGQRLTSPGDGDRPWRATVRGGIVLELSFLLPLVGWFLIFPVSTVTGAGVCTIASIRHWKRVIARRKQGRTIALPVQNSRTDEGAHVAQPASDSSTSGFGQT